MATTELNGAGEDIVGPIRESLKAAEKARTPRFLGSDPAPTNPELPTMIGAGGKIVSVRDDETGLEFIAAPSGGGGATTFVGLSDVPSAYTGHGGKQVRVKSDASGLEFVTAGGGSGDVVGPASATDNAIARYDTTTGKLLQNSTVTISDNGTIGAVAAAAGYASINLPHGTAPTSPNNGDMWTTTAGIYVRINGVTVGPLGTGGGGSLTNFTEAVNTSTPNATRPVVSLTATNAASHVDFAIMVKGNGAILADIPDNASTGGNKRGDNAVDLQITRNNATEVASGTYSGIFSGTGNTASGTFSAVFSGTANTTTGTYAVSLGGTGNTVGGQSSANLAGESNSATGSCSIVHGSRASDRGMVNRRVHGGGRFAADGDAQFAEVVLRRSTTDATQAVLTADAGSVGTGTIPTLPNNSAYLFSGKVIARATSTNDVRVWDFSGIIKRGANAASTAFVGTPAVSAGAGDSGSSSWAISVDADTTRGGLSISVTGAASTTIRWVAVVDTLEVG